MADADVVVIGAGAIGTSVAYHLADRGHDVIVCEKEPGPALHQSGRNSGVVHAGYQYKPSSNKARFATEGAKRLRVYCQEHGIPIRQDGLLVVAQDEADMAHLELARERSKTNGVKARLVDQAEMAEIEPHADGLAGLHVPSYASFDARAYVHALTGDAMGQGAEFFYDTTVQGLEETGSRAQVHTDKGRLTARAAVNAAGLFADRIAEETSQDLRIIPFRGYYAELVADARHLCKSHIYPTPDPELPFLGVHLSRRADGRVIVGPGAMLAFGREAYRFHQVSLRDLASTLTWPGFWRLFKEERFRRLTRQEIKKSLWLKAIWREAKALVPELTHAQLTRSFAGNRAQMVSRDGRLVMDLIVRETDHAVHVLNAISPGLTCSLPFGEHLADRVEERL